MAMNAQNEQAFWMELFAVKIRYEERKNAAQQSDLELLEKKQGRAADYREPRKHIVELFRPEGSEQTSAERGIDEFKTPRHME